MKFVEVLCGQIVNVDEIAYLDHECSVSDRVFSYMYLKNGKKIDFLDTSREFNDLEGNLHSFNGNHMIELHKIAIRVIDSYFTDYTYLLSFESLEERVWDIFMNETVFNKEKPVIDN